MEKTDPWRVTIKDGVHEVRTKQRMDYPGEISTLHPGVIWSDNYNDNSKRFGRVECLSWPIPAYGTKLQGDEMLDRRVLSMGI